MSDCVFCMEIYFEEGQEVSPEILETMKKSAARCLELEGVDESRTEISVSFVEAEEIKRLNAEYRQVDSVTDVLSFPQFDDMFKTFQGVTEDSKSEIYLRPETAQGIFVNFKNVQRTSRKKIPFGIAQIGKSFRNEITPGNFIFRIREFEQMELEFFCKPGTDLEWFAYWKDYCENFLKSLNMDMGRQLSGGNEIRYGE